MTVHDLARRVLEGDVRSAARVLRLIDDRAGDYLDVLKSLFPHTGRAYVIGVTGNPGAGKSTLCDRLIEALRAEGKKVGVIAVDPSSPYSGGAILGDRIRMARHATDPGVFIRSVATRGHLGGLSRSARDMVRVLDAYGCDVILVETVGVGQDELEITRTAHTTLVVMAPGLGDEIQAIKAGLLECADVFAVNKADREGADATVRDLELMIALGKDTMIASGKTKGHVVHDASYVPGVSDAKPGEVQRATQDEVVSWTPPIVRCIATKKEGIDALVEACMKHRAWVETSRSGRARRLLRLAEEVREALREALIDAAEAALGPALDAAVAQVAARKKDPYTATEELVSTFRAAPRV